jgi:hypothetical protein
MERNGEKKKKKKKKVRPASIGTKQSQGQLLP